MTSRTHRSGSRPALRLAALIVAVAVSVSGCAAAPPSREAGASSREAGESSREAGAPSREDGAQRQSEAPTPTVFTFSEGASLTEDSDIGWGDGLAADPGWTSVPSDHPGRWLYVNASGGCSASFRGGVWGDSSAMDDREASDATIEAQAGDEFLGADWITDGVFRQYETTDSVVEHRQLSYTLDGYGYFIAARAFVEADYSVWVIVTCEGEPFDPVVQEVLTKNFIALDPSAE